MSDSFGLRELRRSMLFFRRRMDDERIAWIESSLYPILGMSNTSQSLKASESFEAFV
jgi:hypothetical protein